jgi:hypothetical protein
MNRPFKEVVKEFENDPASWELVQTDVQPSTNRRNPGGSSVQEVFRHRMTGEELVRHTVYNGKGMVFRPPHLRPYYK